MKLLLLLAVVTSDLAGVAAPAQPRSPRTHSPLRLLAETKSGANHERRGYTSVTWYVENAGPGVVWLPLPKDRLKPRSASAGAFKFRARGSGGWSHPRLAEHEVTYEADWVGLAPGEKYQLFAVTFYTEAERFKEVEVSLTYRDGRGKARKARLSWSAASRLPRRAPSRWRRVATSVVDEAGSGELTWLLR